MDRKEWFQSEKAWIIVLITLAAAVRLFFLLSCDNMLGNATDAVVRALDIVANPSLRLNFEGNRSTLFNYGLAAFLFFWRDPILAPRVFALLFGTFLVIPYYGTLKIVFNRTIAFFSSLVLVFYPLHVVQSSTATSETAFFFFLFSSLYFFFKFTIGQGRKSSLWLSVFLFNIAALLRMESWVFMPFFFFLLWPKGKKTAFQFLILSMAAPCLWLMLNQVIHDNLFMTFETAGKTSRKEIAAGTVPYDPRVISWLVLLWRSSGASLVIGGLCGVLVSFFMRKKFELALFFMGLLSTFTISSCSARLWHAERYSIILALLLIPYAWFFMDKALTFLGDRKKWFFLLFLIFPATDAWQIARHPHSTMPYMFCFVREDINHIADWLKKNVGQNESLVVGSDRYDVFPSYIMLRGGVVPSSRYMIVWNAVPYIHNIERFEWYIDSKGKFERYMRIHRPKYLVLNSESYLQKILGLDLSKKGQGLGDAELEVVFEQNVPMFGNYIVYKITYKNSSGGADV